MAIYGRLNMSLDISNKEELKEEFLKLFETADIRVSISWGCVHVTVYSEYSLSLDFKTLIKISEIFGTTKFKIIPDKEVETYPISEITLDSETTYSYEYICKLEDINTGLPWKEDFIKNL